MALKKLVLIPLSLLFLNQCSKEDELALPSCIEQKIETLKKEAVWNPPAKIYRYNYQNQYVYFFPQRCCDIPSELYTENCNLLCLPDGGRTGEGDGKCTDFFKTRTEPLLVWEDTRKE